MYLLYDLGEYDDRDYVLIDVPGDKIKPFKRIMLSRYDLPIAEFDAVPILHGVRKTKYTNFLKRIMPKVKSEKRIRKEAADSAEYWQKFFEENKSVSITGSGWPDLYTQLEINKDNKKERQRIKDLLHIA